MYIILRTRILVMLHGYNSFHLKRKKNSMLPSYKPKNEKKKNAYLNQIYTRFLESLQKQEVYFVQSKKSFGFFPQMLSSMAPLTRGVRSS